MARTEKILAATLLGMIFMTPAFAETTPCPTCDRSQPSMREQIKAERAKYDRENVKTTARPWDGLRLGRAEPDRKPPPN